MVAGNYGFAVDGVYLDRLEQNRDQLRRIPGHAGEMLRVVFSAENFPAGPATVIFTLTGDSPGDTAESAREITKWFKLSPQMFIPLVWCIACPDTEMTGDDDGHFTCPTCGNRKRRFRAIVSIGGNHDGTKLSILSLKASAIAGLLVLVARRAKRRRGD